MKEMQQNEQIQPAKPRSLRIRDFLYHFVVYLFVLAILLITHGANGAFVWLGLVWGFAVAMHGIYAYFG